MKIFFSDALAEAQQGVVESLSIVEKNCGEVALRDVGRGAGVDSWTRS